MSTRPDPFSLQRARRPDGAPAAGTPGSQVDRGNATGHGPVGPETPRPGRPGGQGPGDGPAPGADQPPADPPLVDQSAQSRDEGQADGGTILTDVAALALERDEYLGALQRLQADFENFRKRVLRQQQEQSERAAQDLVGKLLPVLDTLDLAEDHLGAGEEGGVTAEGKALSQARAMLIDVLGREGLERLDQSGIAFDPVVHDAVAHAPAADDDEKGSGETLVDEVLRSGYRWRGHVLRPAMVRVRG